MSLLRSEGFCQEANYFFYPPGALLGSQLIEVRFDEVANVLERPLLARHRRNGLEIYLHPLSLSRLLPLDVASLELARLHKSATSDKALLSTGSFPIDVVDIRLPCKLDHRTIRSG